MNTLPLIAATLTEFRSQPSPSNKTSYITPDGGVWDYDATKAAIDNGGTIVKGFVRRFDGAVYPEWFGAVGDYNQSTNTGTDNTTAFQKAIDYLISVGGGELRVSAKKYFFSGTVYVKPTIQIPIAIKSGFNNTANDFAAANNNGATLIRNTSGAFFAVNLDSNGVSVMPTNSEYFGFSCIGLNFYGRYGGGVYTQNAIAVKSFRCRLVIRDCNVKGMAHLWLASPTDSAGNGNYCGHCIIDNIRVFQSTLSVINIINAESVSIRNIYYEDPSPTGYRCIEIKAGTGSTITNVVHGANFTESALANSAFIYLDSCLGVTITGMHTEYVHLLSIIYLYYCTAVTIESIFTKFESKDAIVSDNCNGVFINGHTSQEDKVSGYFDLKTIASTGVVRQNCLYYTWSSGSPVTRQILLSVSGIAAGNRGPLIHAHIYWVSGNTFRCEDNNGALIPGLTAAMSGAFLLLSAPYDKLAFVTVSQRMRSGALVGYVPVYSNYANGGTTGIRFYNQVGGANVTTPDANFDFDIIMAAK